MRPLRCIVPAIVAVIVACTAAKAQSDDEKAACRPDVFRLCSAGSIAAAAFGDRSGIYDCFKQHRHELSRACDRVLRAHGY